MEWGGLNLISLLGGRIMPTIYEGTLVHEVRVQGKMYRVEYTRRSGPEEGDVCDCLAEQGHSRHRMFVVVPVDLVLVQESTTQRTIEGEELEVLRDGIFYELRNFLRRWETCPYPYIASDLTERRKRDD